MNATAWASTASLELAECTTEQRRRDQAQQGWLRQQTMPLAAHCSRGMFHWSANWICWPGRPDIFRILETIKDRGAFIKPLTEPIIDTTSDNMWVEAFVTFLRFCGHRAQDDPHAGKGVEGQWRTVLHWRRSPSSTLTKLNRLGGCWRNSNRSERWHDCLAWITSRIL